MSFIKKIFEGKIDENVHKQFTRFGKGDFGGRALVSFRKTAEGIKVNGSFEYANDFASLAVELGGGKVSGKVFSKEGISSVMSSNNIKGYSETKRGGLFYQNNIEEQNLNEEQLKALLENSYFCLLDMLGKDFELKTKKNLPKPGKGGKGKMDTKFCQLDISEKYWSAVKALFFWDFPECKKGTASHEYIINELVLPQGEKDFEKIRVMAKRRGKIIRSIEADGSEKKVEKEIIV
jgi:hypothetical protein